MKKQLLKLTALVMLVSLVIEIFFPIALLALTGGPSQPEFSKFEPVSTTSMVNEFDGSFTYNLPVLHIPGPDGGEYALSLSYHSGASPEEEASWVGYGWTLNPGSIARNKRGFPDDHIGADVTYWNRAKKNWTLMVGRTDQYELFSYDKLNVGHQTGDYMRYNSYRGFGRTQTEGVSLGYDNMSGLASLSVSVDDENGTTFSGNISPGTFLCGLNVVANNQLNISPNEKSGVVFTDNLLIRGARIAANVGAAYAFRSGTDRIRPTSLTPYSGASYNLGYIPQLTSSLPVGQEVGIHGTYTYQENEEQRILKTYGYMYSGHADEEGVMDYHVEKNSPYSRRDYFLSIPYSSADNFTVTGEGIAGGFRLFRNTAGHFKPNKIESYTDIFQGKLDLHKGENLGAGSNIGVGRQTTTVGEWPQVNPNYTFNEEQVNVPRNGEMFFRYNNDPGGSIAYSSSDNAEQASIVSQGSGFRPYVNRNSFYSSINNAEKTGRSSYIGHRTINDMRRSSPSGTGQEVYYRSFSKGNTAIGPFTPSRHYFLGNSQSNSTVYENSIGEISTVNDQGYRYTYGLPVYSRGEYNINYGVDPREVGTTNRIIHKQLLPPDHSKPPGYVEPSTLIGEKRAEPYATSYLLTEITTSDFVDRTQDGLTDDDFGGYVQFHYKRAATPAGTDVATIHDKKNGNTGWYRWRVPYTGFFYNQNEISNPDDDMASMSSGEKEMYYMQAVETKTHIAVFVTNKTDLTFKKTVEGQEVITRHITGSQNERLDAYEAALEASANHDDPDIHSDQQVNKSEYLERIELYAKDADGNPGTLLKTVYFEYEYTLMKGQPNGAIIASNKMYPQFYCGNFDVIEGIRAGKLTLRRVWTEYEGVANAKIAPYEFDYNYKKASDFPEKLSDLYSDIIHYSNALSGDRGAAFYNLIGGTDQNPNYNAYGLDPWGNYRKDGEQRFDKRRPWLDQSLEGNTAGFDPAAWQLKSVRLPTGGEILVQYEQHTYNYVQDKPAMAMVSLLESAGNRYYLNLDELGLTEEEKLETLRMIRREFIDNADRNKMYFKFLYSLPITVSPGPNSLLSEYITGYVNISNIGQDLNGNIYIELDQNSNVPADICREFVQKHRGGLTPNSEPFSDAAILSDTYETMYKLATFLMPPITYCTSIRHDYSFLKIPIAAPKKGGGVRVKRLLMYDKGIEEGDAALYGTEYIYETNDATNRTVSSGVAANEPSEIREENALVRFLKKREDQNFLQNITAGKDKEQFEGPIGEALLPGAAIGYSRVVSRNIHQGTTAPGFVVSEYHTWKDHPLRVEHTPIVEEPDFYTLPTGVFNEHIDNLWVTQGYSFVMNNMPGQPSSTITYAGEYGNPSTWLRSTSQQYEYLKPGDEVPMHSGVDKPLQYAFPGKEMEVVFESRSVEDEVIDGTVQVDFSVSKPPPPFLPTPIPFVTLMPQLTHSTSKLRTHVTNKIISYPALLKSMRVFKDGVEHYSEHVAFDPNTGKPIITRSTDGFDGLNLKNSANHDGNYYSWQVPAAQQYEGMGQKAWNEQTLFKSANPTGLKFVKQALSTGDDYYIEASTNPASNSYCVYDLRQKFSEGDLVELWNGTQSAGIFHVESIVGNTIDLEKTSYSSTHTNAVGGLVDVEVLASGRTNQLVGGAGAIASYGRNTSSADNTPTFMEFPKILHDRQKLVEELNKALKELPIDYSRTINLPTGLQYNSGSWLNFPSGSVLEIRRLANQYEIRVGVKTLRSYSATYPGVTHPLVNFLNQAMNNFWSVAIDPITPSVSVVANTLGFNEYRYRANDLALVQNDMNNFVATQSNDGNGRFDWVNEAYSSPFSLSMLPATNTGYSGEYVTGYQGLTAGMPIVLASLQVSHGSTPIMSAYIQSKGTNQARWNIAPVNCGGTVTSTPLPLLLYAMPRPMQFTQVGDKIYLGSSKCPSLPAMEIPGITLNKRDWEGIPVCTQTLLLDGMFELNEKGQIVYHRQADDGYCSLMLNCPQFWPTLEEKSSIFSNIVSASVQTYGNSWGYNPGLYKALPDNFEPNHFETGEVGKWRPLSAYVYNTDVPDTRNGNKLSLYQRGVFSDFTLFNWKQQHLNNPSKWIRSSTALAYSPNGQMLAEIDALDMASAAKFGYSGTMPYLVVKNALPNAVHFESFENVYTRGSAFYLEDGAVLNSVSGISSTYAHAGKKSYWLNSSSYTTGAIRVSRKTGIGSTEAAGVSVKVWVKHPSSETDIPFEGTLALPVGTSLSLLFTKIARTGEWTLYEAKVQSSSLMTFLDKDATVTLSKKASVASEVFIDDVRVQPLDAAATCYVYDVSTFRLIGVFDDQHFGLYYQYNAEGKLVRKIAETERGLKTIVETQYHTPLANYTVFSCPPSGGGGDDGGPPDGDALINPSHSGLGNSTDARNSILNNRNDGVQEARGGVDLLDVKITPDGQSIKLFGNDKLSVPDSLKSPVPDVRMPDVKPPATDSLSNGVRKQTQKMTPRTNGMQGIEKTVRSTQDSLKTVVPPRPQSSGKQ